MELDIAVIRAKLEHCLTEERDTTKTPAVDLFLNGSPPPPEITLTLYVLMSV